MIEIRHLRKVYPNAEPLKDVNTVINDGDIISVIGPSGTGKSTLLRCLNMLEKPTSGQIIVGGVDITAPECRLEEIRRKMGMVFQSFNLFGHRTVVENVMMPPVDLLGMSRQEAYEQAALLLDKVGLSDKMFNYPDELSGGQQQRVAIARTLSMNPRIILFDEPTSALDPTMVGEVESVIRALGDEGHTMMIVTHEMNFARQISNRVFYMDEGGIYEDGTPDQIFSHPVHANTRKFIFGVRGLVSEHTRKDLNFPHMQDKFAEFARRNRIPALLVNHAAHVADELFKQNIYMKINDNTRYLIGGGYRPGTGQMVLGMMYDDDIPDPVASLDGIARAIVERYTKEPGEELRVYFEKRTEYRHVICFEII